MNTELVKYAQRTGTIASLSGLAVGYLAIASLISIDSGLIKGLTWIIVLDEYWINVLIGGIGMVVSAYIISGFSVNTNTMLVSILKGAAFAIASLLLGTIIGSTPGFLQEAQINQWPSGLTDDLFDYYGKPLIWIGFFGSIPAAIIGGIWGGVVYRAIKRRA